MPFAPIPHRRRHTASIAVSLRWLGMRHGLALLFLLACGLVEVGQHSQEELAVVRARAVEGMAPLLSALRAPGQAIEDIGAATRDWIAVHDENARLRSDNAALLRWRGVAEQLSAENARLAQLTNFQAAPQTSVVTAPVVADIGGPYQRAALVLAGANDGVMVGAVALASDDTVVGRVTEVGPTSARVLLLTDPTGRIPARLENSGATAIVAGGGAGAPELLYLPRDVTPQEGERVLSSGHGGVFPAGLPIGTVQLDGDGHATVAVSSTADTLDLMRLVDFRVTAPAAPATTTKTAPKH